MMNVQRKLKVYAVLTFVGLVMMIVMVVSPGWTIIDIPVRPPQLIDTEGIDGPVAMEKRSAEHHSHHHHNDDEDYHRKSPRVRISMGLWYYVICFHGCRRSMERDGMTMSEMHESKGKHKCHITTYQRNTELPYEFVSASDVYSTIKGIGREGLIEFQIESAVGLACGLLGFIASVLYVRQQAQKRSAGLVACIALIVAGVLCLVLVGKTITAQIMYMEMYQESFEGEFHLNMRFPWGILVGGLSGTLVLISALGHLCILSRNSKSDDVHVYHIQRGTQQGCESKYPFSTISPPGYEQHVGLKESLKITPEEAGPLPHKEQI